LSGGQLPPVQREDSFTFPLRFSPRQCGKSVASNSTRLPPLVLGDLLDLGHSLHDDRGRCEPQAITVSSRRFEL
jgi:hypothetical protein